MTLTKGDPSFPVTLSPSPNYDAPSGRRHGLFVVHDVESPLTQNYATVLAGPAWFGSTKAGTSAHYMTGPDKIIQMVDESDRAWHIGGPGNNWSEGSEQPGYAKFTRAEWTTAAGLRQIDNLGKLIADWAKRHGATTAPTQATDDQLKSYANGSSIGFKWTHHYNISNTKVSNTVHWDTGSSYPDDLLQQAINKYFNPTPAPEPFDLLEWIMSLPGAPANLTYDQLLNDIAARSASTVFKTVFKLRSAIKKDAAGKPAPDVNRAFGDAVADIFNYSTVAVRNTSD